MRAYHSLFLIIWVVFLGCKKEYNTTEADKISNKLSFNKATKFQTVTSVDGTVNPYGCTIETLPSGEIYEICKPANWNGELILYAHGYVSAYQSLALPAEAAEYAPLFISLGYAFATTSYSENGLAVQTGIRNILDLRKRFIDQYGQPSHIYLAGGSEGGLVATLAIERYPGLFTGGLPLCGPCGDFQKQINYYGDFRVLFDYFFPQLLPGNVINIPDKLIKNWQSYYMPQVLKAITIHPATTIKLLNTAHAAYVPGNDSSIAVTVLGLLWYDVFAMQDAAYKLGGQPYDNTTTTYLGTGSLREDFQLNRKVQRYRADKKALKTIQTYYQTSGRLSVPVVLEHTTLDPLIPFWHVPLYTFKTLIQGSASRFIPIPVPRYGHCAFTEAEIAGAFALLILRTQGLKLARAERLIAMSSTTNGKIVQSVRTQ